MTVPPSAPGSGEFVPAPGSDVSALPSLVAALIQDRERLHQARRALQHLSAVPQWTARFGLLSDENRLKILLAIHRAPGITVKDLAGAVRMSNNATSQALSALRVAGAVTTARDGRLRRWTIADEDIHQLLHAVVA